MSETNDELFSFLKKGITYGLILTSEIKDEELRGSNELKLLWNQVAVECREIAENQPFKNNKKIKLENFSDLDVNFNTNNVNNNDKLVSDKLVIY